LWVRGKGREGEGPIWRGRGRINILNLID